MFKRINKNPKQRKTDDCAIRALSTGFNKEWIEVFDELTALARSIYSVPCASETVKEYLHAYPVLPVKYHTESGGKKRYKVKDICDLKGSYIIKISNKFTCVVDGVLHDLWDCRDHVAHIVWKIR